MIRCRWYWAVISLLACPALQRRQLHLPRLFQHLCAVQFPLEPAASTPSHNIHISFCPTAPWVCPGTRALHEHKSIPARLRAPTQSLQSFLQVFPCALAAAAPTDLLRRSSACRGTAQCSWHGAGQVCALGSRGATNTRCCSPPAAQTLLLFRLSVSPQTSLSLCSSGLFPLSPGSRAAPGLEPHLCQCC